MLAGVQVRCEERKPRRRIAEGRVEAFECWEWKCLPIFERSRVTATGSWTIDRMRETEREETEHASILEGEGKWRYWKRGSLRMREAGGEVTDGIRNRTG